MNIGLLWYDDNLKRSLTEKVLAAAARHLEKYNEWPDICHVHPSSLNGNGAMMVNCGNGASIRVVGSPNTLRHHFWIGMVDNAHHQER